jgi:hypothetical protein
MTGPDPLVLETVCPRCGTRMDRAIDFEKPGDLPEAGDIALCYGCADWAVFTKDRTLRLPTVFEAAEIARQSGPRSGGGVAARVKRSLRRGRGLGRRRRGVLSGRVSRPNCLVQTI